MVGGTTLGRHFAADVEVYAVVGWYVGEELYQGFNITGWWIIVTTYVPNDVAFLCP